VGSTPKYNVGDILHLNHAGGEETYFLVAKNNNPTYYELVVLRTNSDVYDLGESIRTHKEMLDTWSIKVG
jgi:hypothetical protein